MRRRMLALGAALAVLALASGGARADAPVAQGWWWAPNDAALPATPPAVPTITIPLSPPDVPPDALYVATNATGMEAMAALLYVIPEGAEATALTLEVTGTTAGAPEVQLCPTTSSWSPVSAGPWGARPQYECAAGAPVGVLSEDGTTMTWTLGSLGGDQAVDLALVPVVGTDPLAPTTRITFAKPSPQSLTVTEAEVGEEPFSLAPPDPVAPPSSSFDSVDVVAASQSTFSGGFDSITPLVRTPPAVEGAAPRTNFDVPRPVRPGGLIATPVSNPTTRDRMQTLGMFGLIALAFIYARFSSQAQREPRSLVTFAKHGAPGPEAPA